MNEWIINMNERMKKIINTNEWIMKWMNEKKNNMNEWMNN